MSKQTFGKDENGVFHPKKGKPSGVNKSEGLGIHPTEPGKMEEYLELTEKYTMGEDELDPAVRVRHPNRNTSKGEDTFKAKENQPESDKTMNEAFNEEDMMPVVEAKELPAVLSRAAFKELAEYRAECTLTIYLKSHESGVEVNEHYDPVNFKNQLQEANRRLLEKGYNEAAIKPLLQPAFELLRNDTFWQQLSPGLALFIADGYLSYLKMPVAPAEELLVIEPTFFVTPLVPLLSSPEYFYLLVISKKCAKIFKADANGMERLPIELPQSIEEVKRLSDLDATTFRSGSSGSRAPVASQEGSYHGAGGGNVGDKENLLTYFEAVDDILWDKLLNKENAPLLLAAVEYELPIYRSACDYHNVWPEALTGNREHQETTALYKDAKETMEPYFKQRLTKALDTYMNNIASGKTSSITADIIPAAYYSQVSHLFVAQGEHVWGIFNDADNTLQFHASPDEGGEDLLDNAVVKTLANGGEVFLVEKEQMPEQSQMAAIMRY